MKCHLCNGYTSAGPFLTVRIITPGGQFGQRQICTSCADEVRSALARRDMEATGWSWAKPELALVTPPAVTAAPAAAREV